MAKGLYNQFSDTWIIDGVRTPLIDYCGALGNVSPTDMGIKVAKEILRRTATDPRSIESVLTGNMAQASFDAFVLPRHIGLYAGVPVEVGAVNVQRICGTGFELFRQAGEQIQLGVIDTALVVGTESMTRNPIAAYTHRTGFRLGAGVEFKDFLWEALIDPAADVTMIQTAENLAKKYGITRAAVDEFASMSFARAVAARERGFHAGEIVALANEKFDLGGYQSRGLKISGKEKLLDSDTHPRLSPVEVLAKLRTVYPDGVQTGGNSSALVDGAAAAVVASGAVAKAGGRKPLARLVAAAVVGVPPEIMGIGPAPAIRLLLERSGLKLDEIGCFEINEAQGAQTIACERELGLDRARLNVNGGAIALGHPLAATGVRLTVTAARAMAERGEKYSIASACVGGGQGIALLLENPAA